jgi:NADPH2:quinone reductase
MEIRDVDNPVPSAGQVVVRVRAAGVNPVDTYIRSGQYALRPKPPYTPGMDAAGIVEAVGEGVRSFHQDDRVYVAGSLSGTYAEKTLCRENQVHKLPGAVSFSQGAAMGVPYATAYYGLFHRARALPGETVLIHGATGGVGSAALQIARAAGMFVIGTGGTEEGRRLIMDQGAHHALDHHDQSHTDKVLELTDGRGADVILEMLSNMNLDKDLGVLAHRGRVVVIGSRGRVEIDPRDAMRRHASILGMMLLNVSDEELYHVHAALGAGLENGTLKPVVGRELPLAEAARAHHEIMESHAYGKMVLAP